MARQKITDNGDTQDAFADLTAKQQEFIVHLSSGMTQLDAYKRAYAPENSSDQTISVDASRLANHPKILPILNNLAVDKLDAAKLNLADHSREMLAIAKRAELAGNFGAAVQALQLRAKAHGLYTDRVADVTESDPREVLHRIARLDPSLAAKLAADAGIDWIAPDSGTEH